jgi:hypothetical protein
MIKVLLSICFIFSVYHPFYVGLMEIHYKKADLKLEITHKAFFDDLEHALSETTNKKWRFELHSDNQKFKTILENYIKSHFKFVINGKTFDYDFLGFEKEDDVVYIYCEIHNVSNVKKLEVQNTLLCDYFKEQQNIINVFDGSQRPKSGIAKNNKSIVSFEF